MVAPQDLIDKAVADTGFHDFGGDSFREGLERLLRSLDDEARLNANGEGVIYPRLIHHLSVRLEVEDWYRRHPEIEEVDIVEPLFGIGLPRTGSTALSFLLAQDPEVRYLRQWESAQPCPPPSTVDGPDPRYHVEGPKIGTKDHVPNDAHGPMECLDLMALDFKTPIYDAFARIPSYAAWRNETDLQSTYLYERRVLKMLQWGEPARPWRLKSPAHMLWVTDLAAAFPDARFVMTHRDPTDVLLSVCDVFADISAGFTDELDRRYIGDLNAEQWAVGIERLMDFRDNGGEDRFYDIDFRAMQSDPIGEVRGLYDWLDVPVTARFETRMQSWWDENAAEREPSEHSDPATYGLDLQQIRERFAPYVARCAGWTSHAD